MSYKKFEDKESESLEERYNNLLRKYKESFSEMLQVFVDDMFTFGYTMTSMSVENCYPKNDSIKFEYYHPDVPDIKFTAEFYGDRRESSFKMYTKDRLREFERILIVQDEIYIVPSRLDPWVGVSLEETLHDFWETILDEYHHKIEETKWEIQRNKKEIKNLTNERELLKDFLGG